jgi:hypothetical protein
MPGPTPTPRTVRSGTGPTWGSVVVAYRDGQQPRLEVHINYRAKDVSGLDLARSAVDAWEKSLKAWGLL